MAEHETTTEALIENGLVERAGEHSGEGEHGEAHGSGHPPEVPSFFDLIAQTDFAQNKATVTVSGKEEPIEFSLADAIHAYQNQFLALMLVAVTAAVLSRKLGKLSMKAPGRFQAAIERIVEAFRDLVYGVLGEKNGRRYLPYIGSLFFFILLCNLMGIVPLLRSPTSIYKTTFALGLCTFLYVQFTAVTRTGPIRYLYHLAGEPQGDNIFMLAFMWLLGVFLLFPLHVLSEIIKPISLSLRLFGNILGEDILIGVFTMFGLSILGLFGMEQPWVGFPMQLPFFFLALLTSTVQALVFALLSMVYFLMVLPHEETPH